MKFGLEGIKALLHELCHPHEALRSVHIAGTNGKGSTSAMLRRWPAPPDCEPAYTLLLTLLISPSASRSTEVRFRKTASHDSPLRYALRVSGYAGRGVLQTPPSFFEQVTAAGFLFFAEEKAELVVLEVGLGGRLDATNICRPVVSAITTIGEDHQQYLGNSLAAIAFEKAGIIKPGVPVVSAPQSMKQCV